MPRRWSWVLLGSSLLGACSSDEPSRYEAGVADVCHGACVGYQRCSLSGSNCESFCVDNYDPRGIRGEALSVVGECLKTEACDTLASETPFSPCFDQAAAVAPLRDALINYCETAAKSYFECNVFWSVEECAHTMGVWSDDVLEAAALCFGKDCDAVPDCEKATFEDPP